MIWSSSFVWIERPYRLPYLCWCEPLPSNTPARLPSFGSSPDCFPSSTSINLCCVSTGFLLQFPTATLTKSSLPQNVFASILASHAMSPMVLTLWPLLHRYGLVYETVTDLSTLLACQYSCKCMFFVRISFSLSFCPIVLYSPELATFGVHFNKRLIIL